jgi:hypothetical protein
MQCYIGSYCTVKSVQFLTYQSLLLFNLYLLPLFSQSEDSNPY